MSNTKKGTELKIQVNATFTVIGSKAYSDAAKAVVLNAPAGKQRWLVVEFVDDAGQTVQFKVAPRLSKPLPGQPASLTSRLTDKAVGYLMTETLEPGKAEVKAATKAAERASIEAQLLALDK